MKPVYTQSLTILPSQVDAGGRLSHDRAFDLFMDTATLAADAMGLGWNFLIARGLFWITVRSRIRFIERPKLMDAVQVTTWPEPPEEMRCCRQYHMTSGGRTLLTGRTEWAIVDIRSKKPVPLGPIMPPDVEYPAESVSPEPFTRFHGAFADAPFAEHRVTATDIDMAGHMNNVAYIRALMNAFDPDQWQRMDVSEIELVYLTSARAGDALRFQKRRAEGALEIRGTLPDGKVSLLARMACREG